MHISSAALALLLPALALSAPITAKRGSGPVTSAKEAKRIAEQDTGGRATSARRIFLNGASGAWEVDVRMPREARGWRCTIDADTRMVHSKTRIDQPGDRAEGSKRTVRGIR
jgi:hypothetical protein